MDLTSDHIGKTMLRFSIPIVLAFFLQSVYGIVDLLIVGHFGGTYALAGVNMGSQIMDFVLGIATGLLGGGRIIILGTTAGLGVAGIGLAFPISTAVTVLVYLVPFAKGLWKESTVRSQ